MPMDTLGALPFDAAAPIWADIEPVAQEETDTPLCPILYADEYSRAMDLLRALMRTHEHSPRALALTEHLVRLNPSNYTVWDFRAQVLEALHRQEEEEGGGGGQKGPGKLLEAELGLLDDMAVRSMKNYQVWQQRKRIVALLGDPSRELSFTATVLANDAKNYHTWVYRQWVLCYFGGLPSTSSLAGSSTAAAPPPSGADKGKGKGQGQGEYAQLWDGELEYTDALLEEDVRNNSAWNHRFFVLFASGRARAGVVRAPSSSASSSSADAAGSAPGPEAEAEAEAEWVRREAGYAKAKIALTPNNASAWNYLRGILRLNSTSSTRPLSTPNTASFALSLIPSHAEAVASPQIDAGGRTSWLALEWLLDVEEERARTFRDGEGEVEVEALEISKNVHTILQRLLIADPMRKRYWHYKAERILGALALGPSSSAPASTWLRAESEAEAPPTAPAAAAVAT
ncbi:CAAX geranylgeranyltransferase alpha subunit [Tilletia horrida]|nr:CAAX geranylgeranyltransferase alpha subunit [Tilletia horrida]